MNPDWLLKNLGKKIMRNQQDELSLLKALTSVLRGLQAETQSRWNRLLPFGEYFTDRWERAKMLGFGEGSSIYDSSVVLGTVTVGDHSWIGPFTVLDGTGGLSIGSYCSISSGVQIYSHDTVAWSVSGGKVRSETAPTHIGSRCYIGPNTIISKGITIGDGCVVGANSFVNKNLEAGTKAFGSPCRVVSSTEPLE